MQVSDVRTANADLASSRERLLLTTQRVFMPISLVVLFLTTFDARFNMPAPAYVALELGLIAGAYFWLPRNHYRLFFLYIVCFNLFVGLRLFADETGMPVSYSYPLDADTVMLGANPSTWLQERLYTPGKLGVLEWSVLAVYTSYFVGHFVFTAALWCFKRELLQPCIAAIVLTLFAGLVVYFALPTAPPWLAAEQGVSSPVVRIAHSGENQLLADAHERGSYVAGENDVGAMPSLHTAVTVIIALALWRLGMAARVAGIAYVAAMGFALVYLGEHYFVDVLAGIVIGFLAWAVVQGLRRRRIDNVAEQRNA
ncbi:MAG TPA: phosphatase PAP2 family protein [Dehalococcoidia bacterium]|nr:phosphatase PAP2 family protein [Dehalococcoidia bacterium]